MENLCATARTYHHTRRVAMHSKTCFPNWLSSRIGFGSASVRKPSGMGFVFTKTFSQGSQLILKYHLRKLFSFSVALHKGIFLPFDTVGKVSTPHGSDLCSPIFP